MKRIEAIIKDESLDRVKYALGEAGFTGMTVINCRGRGSGGGIDLQWRATTYTVDLLHKIMLILVVKDENVQQVIDIIVKECQGQEDDTTGTGKIFVSPVEQVVRIRTNEQNEDAL